MVMRKSTLALLLVVLVALSIAIPVRKREQDLDATLKNEFSKMLQKNAVKSVEGIKSVESSGASTNKLYGKSLMNDDMTTQLFKKLKQRQEQKNQENPDTSI